MSSICRAITFISYHIPLSKDEGKKPQYCTIGFFDGMFTESLCVDYAKEDLKELWRYTVRTTAASQGKFSYQNIFGFSDDAWNEYSDKEFWEQSSDEDYPLLFVAFLQLSDYMAAGRSIEAQCKTFASTLKKHFGSSGKFYVYGTIDKNDFVICIRSRYHRQVLEAVKKLHGTGCNVVYSYTILSISNHVLDNMTPTHYSYIFDQSIDSICLKGITNSYNPKGNITLDQRYYEFCEKLVLNLYGEEKEKKKESKEYCIYDIMGDDDFRLIARNVNLGKLLREFGEKGRLGYYQGNFRFYLYSSSLVLNTLTQIEDVPGKKEVYDSEVMVRMDEAIQTPFYNKLSQKMDRIIEIVKHNDKYDEKNVTICQAVWQLLQSLKVLESAPTKQYDFFSIYHPFATLVRILQNRLDDPRLGENDRIYEFIHKISMTLHGTLRTDIQFFQIRDFNVIVHYAPAKLRAFYGLWALKLSEYYNSFEDSEKKYSFILSPGMFEKTNVEQLFLEYDQQEQLMLITIPERHLYIPRWLSIILAHEVSHFVGTSVRKRDVRHSSLLLISLRVMTLELQHYIYSAMPEKYKLPAEKMISKDETLQMQLERELKKADDGICEGRKDPYLYHSKESIKIIRLDYREMRGRIIKKILYDYGESLNQFLWAEQVGEDVRGKKYILDICNELEDNMLLFFEKFQGATLLSVLKNANHLCTEAFADIIAILTLDISPEDYIRSFTKSELLDFKERAQKRNEMGILPIRVAIVIESIKKIVKENDELLSRCHSGLKESWQGDVLRDVIFRLESDSSEQYIMMFAYDYKENLASKNGKISNYDSLYDYDAALFGKKILDYLWDAGVNSYLCGYLYECGSAYIKILSEKSKLQIERRDLGNIYQAFTSGEISSVMQEIESFLQISEKNLIFEQ